MSRYVDPTEQLVTEIMVRDIKRSTAIVVPVADRSYGLRDFTIADPDGFGVRFASILEAREPSRGA
jgi:hypothetical protein